MNQRDEATYELLSAYFDGELSADERVRVEHLLATDSEFRQALAQLQSLADDMGALPSYRLDEQFAERVLATAQQAGPVDQNEGHVARPLPRATVSAGHVSRDRVTSPWRSGVGVAIVSAAVLLLAFFLSAPLRNGDGGTSGPVAFAPENQPQKTDDLGGGASAVADVAEPADIGSNVGVTGSEGALQGERNGERIQNPGTAVALGSDIAQVPAGAIANPAPSGAVSVPDSAVASPSHGQVAMTGQEREPNGHVSAGQMASAGTPDVEQSKAPGMVGDGGIGVNSQKVMLVLDVQLTPAGSESGRFERLLRRTGVAFGTSIDVKKQLETTLLKSRFFEPSTGSEDAQDSAGDSSFAVVYVVAGSGAVDQLWKQMRDDTTHFERVTLDLAWQSGDSAVFRQLREMAPTAAMQSQRPDREEMGMARRLELSDAWAGRPAAGSGIPMLSPAAHRPPDESQGDSLPSSHLDDPSGPMGESGAMLGDDVMVEAIIVVRTGRTSE